MKLQECAAQVENVKLPELHLPLEQLSALVSGDTSQLKSLRQSLRACGLDLANPYFSHGERHAASSRVGKSADLFVYAPEGKPKNIVYPLALE